MADQTILARKLFIAKGRVKEAAREIGAQRSAHLHRLDGAARGRAAADLVHDLAQGQTKGDFVKPAVLDVPGDLQRDRAAGAAKAEVLVMLGTLFKDHRDRGQGDDVVHNGRLTHEALQRGQGGLGTHDAALAFKRVQQAGFLAADIGPGTDTDFHVKGRATAQNLCAQQPLGPGDFNCLLHDGNGDGVFGAQIDKALGRATGEPGNHHAFDEGEGVTFHQHAVGKGGAVAFVGVADDVFAVGLGLGHGFPFDAGREARTAAPAQARVCDLGHHIGRGHAEGTLKASQAAMGAVIGERQGVDHADAGKGQARLRLKPRKLFSQAKGLGMRGQIAKERGHIGQRHRAKGHAASGGFHLGQGFQPDHTPAAIAHQRQINALGAGMGADCLGNLIGFKGDGGRIKRQINLHFRPPMMPSSFASSTRPMILPSTMAAGAQAHRPRQNTGSSVTRPSLVVSCHSMPRAFCA